jgi:C1A family cysteine protease
MLNAVARQPIAIGINSNSLSVVAYKSGIMDNPKCSAYLTHAVNIVGYGTEGGKPYWIIKNSWGTRWGEQGYMRIKRDTVNGGMGVCGINKLASYPTI